MSEVGALVIDCIITNEKAEEKVQRITEDIRVGCDHLPLEVLLEGRINRKKGGIAEKRERLSVKGIEFY